jgi:hypothetical protein
VTNYRTSVALFAVAVMIAFIVAAITLNRIDRRQANHTSPPGTIGLAHPHLPLDKAPGEPVQTVQTR